MTDLSSSRHHSGPRTGHRGTEHPSSGLPMLSGNPAARTVGVVLVIRAKGGQR
jgi:hypothetical protein